MHLRDLQAGFLRLERRLRSDPDVKPPGGDWGSEYLATLYVPVATLAEAHGIKFLCPKCYAANGGAIGTHQVICWFRGRVPDDAAPGPGRWTPAGIGLDDLTFVPGHPPMAVSVALTGGCSWHGFVKNGDAS